ncbi:MAG: hypothetical protein DHS20C16_34540 [Phycisphaerae bacterium]|nr:MAG: hypothetical protein DHS20C16_34540 [Phycisphaerae bacterium]
MKTHPRIGIVVVLASAFCFLTGCSEEKKKTHIEEVTGTIESIGNKVVAVRTYSKKHNKELTYKVEVDNETEILINGSIASIKDLKVGETAFGSVRIVEKDDDTKVITAVKVRVERAEVLKAPSTKSESKDKDAAASAPDAKDETTTEDDGAKGSDKSEDEGD